MILSPAGHYERDPFASSSSVAASGACPDSVAPSGAKIVVPALSAPVVGGINCYSNLGFQVVGQDGIPMNGICVVVNTNANIALTTVGDSTCKAAIDTPSTQIVTRTDGNGNVIVDMINSSPTVSGETYWVVAVFDSEPEETPTQ